MLLAAMAAHQVGQAALLVPRLDVPDALGAGDEGRLLGVGGEVATNNVSVVDSAATCVASSVEKPVADRAPSWVAVRAATWVAVNLAKSAGAPGCGKPP